MPSHSQQTVSLMILMSCEIARVIPVILHSLSMWAEEPSLQLTQIHQANNYPQRIWLYVSKIREVFHSRAGPSPLKKILFIFNQLFPPNPWTEKKELHVTDQCRLIHPTPSNCNLVRAYYFMVHSQSVPPNTGNPKHKRWQLINNSFYDPLWCT